MSALKKPQISSSHWVKFAGFLCFRRLWNMQGWADLYMYWRRKWRVSKGEYHLGSGFPIGASSIPVGTRFSVGKSSVLYLCFRPTRERGWLRHLLYGQIAVDRHFSAAVGQADFVTPRWHKCRIFEKQNPTGRRRKQRYIKAPVPPQRHTKTTTAVPARGYPLQYLPMSLHGSLSDWNELLSRSSYAPHRP